MIISTTAVELNESEILNSIYYGEYGADYAVLEAVQTEQEIFDMFMESRYVNALRESGSLSPLQEVELIAMQGQSNETFKQKAIKIIKTIIEKIKAAFKFIIDKIKDAITTALSKINLKALGIGTKKVKYVELLNYDKFINLPRVFDRNCVEFLDEFDVDGAPDLANDISNENFDSISKYVTFDNCKKALIYGMKTLKDGKEYSDKELREEIFDSMFKIQEKVLNEKDQEKLAKFIEKDCAKVVKGLDNSESSILNAINIAQRFLESFRLIKPEEIVAKNKLRLFLQCINVVGAAVPAVVRLYGTIILEAMQIAQKALAVPNSNNIV